MLNDKQYLDDILESIQNKSEKNLNEGIDVLGSIFATLLLWTTQDLYRKMREIFNKDMKECRSGYKDKGRTESLNICRVKLKLENTKKVLETIKKYGPKQCSGSEEPELCKAKLQSDIATLELLAKVLEKKLKQIS
jgi:hypothetical protein